MDFLNPRQSVNPRAAFRLRRRDAITGGPKQQGPGLGGRDVYSLNGVPGLYNTGSFYDTTSVSMLLGKLSSHPNDLAAVYNWVTNENPTGKPSDMLNTIQDAWSAAGGARGSLINMYPERGGYDPVKRAMRPPSSGANQAPPSYGGGYAGTTDMSASAMMSAYSSVLTTLHNWNLDSLTDQAWQMISNPGFHMNAGEVMDKLRNSPEYQAAFPGMKEIRDKGLNLNEQQYIAREMDIQDQFAQNNVPQGMLNKDELGKLVANGVYGTNLQNRIQKGYEAVKNADPYVKQTLQDWYGVKPGHLLGYMLSAKHGMQQIVKQVQAASINTEAHNAKFQGLDQHTAEQLSRQMTSSGYGMDYFRTGFGKAAAEQPLERAQIGQMGQATASQQQILAGNFAGLKQKGVGSQAEAQRAIELASQARTAGLQGGGGYAQTAKGGLGIGSASTEGTGK